MKYSATILFFIMILIAGCDTIPEEFSIIYSMESAGNYKISIEIDKDKNYSVRQQNMFFDFQAGKERINTSEGKLSDDEYAALAELIFRSRLFKMKDAYGFEQDANPDDPFNDFIYQLTYSEGGKTKYISIRSNPKDTYSKSFLQLVSFLSRYASEHLEAPNPEY